MLIFNFHMRFKILTLGCGRILSLTQARSSCFNSELSVGSIFPNNFVLDIRMGDRNIPYVFNNVSRKNSNEFR